MLRRRRWLRPLVSVVVLALAGAACGGGGGSGDATPEISELPSDLLPSEVLGLQVAREDLQATVRGIEEIPNSYLDAVGMFSLRRDQLLQATLQVSRFTDEAHWDGEDFRRSVADQILDPGAELPAFRMGDHTVYQASGLRQTRSVWFEGPYLLVLSTTVDYEQPRALLRELVGVPVGEPR